MGAPQGTSCELNFSGFLNNFLFGTLIFIMRKCIMYWSVNQYFYFFSVCLIHFLLFKILFLNCYTTNKKLKKKKKNCETVLFCWAALGDLV
jgi:hypothetical protein